MTTPRKTSLSSSLIDVRNIEKDTLSNQSYRKVVYTDAGEIQLVLMSLAPGETIPCETHKDVAQFIRVEAGHGLCKIGKEPKETYQIEDGTSLTIPSGIYHCFENTDKRQHLKLYSIYSPPEHPANRHQRRQPKEKTNKSAPIVARTSAGKRKISTSKKSTVESKRQRMTTRQSKK